MPFESNELRNYVYLRSLLDAFQTKVLKYCAEGTTAEERFRRVKEIRDALGSKGTGVRIPLPPDTDVSNQYPTCPPGQSCEGRTCVPDFAKSGWDENDDPASAT